MLEPLNRGFREVIRLVSRSGIRTHHAPFLVLAGACAALWLAHLTIPDVIAAGWLDFSWQQSLAYALRHRLSVVFMTYYGPFGYFVTTVYDAALFWPRLLWECSVKLLVVITLVLAARAMPSIPLKTIFFVSLFLIPAAEGSGTIPVESLYTIGMIAAVLLLATERVRDRALIFALSCLLAAMALIKQTLILLLVPCLCAACGVLWCRGRTRRAAGLGVLVFINLAALWILFGPPLKDFPTYLRAAMDVTAGYSDAMAVEGPAAELYLALLALAGSLWRLSATALAPPLKLERLLLGLTVGAALFQAFKHGFARHDMHALVFFGTVIPLTLLLELVPAQSDLRAKRLPPALLLCLLAAGVGYVEASDRWLKQSPAAMAAALPSRVIRNVDTLMGLPEFVAARQQQRGYLQRAHALPRVKAAVGEASVDILSYEQGILFLNGFNWRPRPVLQSHSTITPYLLGLNAAHFTSPGGSQRPEFVLLKLQPIDGRFPTLEDGEALKVILSQYRPVLTEKSYLLLRAASSPPGPLPRRIALDQEIQLGDRVTLPGNDGEAYLLSAEVRKSLPGLLRSALYKPPPLFLEITKQGGGVETYRFIPGMGKNGFLLDPPLRNQDDLVYWLTGMSTARLQSFRLTVDAAGRKYYHPRIRIRVEAVPAPLLGRGSGAGEFAENSEEALVGTGLDALYRRHDPDAASEKFRRAIELNPAHYGATYQLALSLDGSGRRDEARAAWERVLAMADGYSDRGTVGQARSRLGLASMSSEALMQAGLDALYGRRDEALAAAYFRKVLEENPQHYGATYQLAAALDAAGRSTQARPLWEKVLQMAEAYRDQATAETARRRLGLP